MSWRGLGRPPELASTSIASSSRMTDRQALEKWLVLANKRYREEGISNAARPWKAVSEYSIEFRHSFVMGGMGPDKFIFEWFKQRSKAGSVRDLIDGKIFQGHALARLKSADQDIRAANHLLLVDKANPVCARSYRFVAEKLLKAVGWQSGVITSEAEEQRTFSHGLKDLAKECGQKTGGQFSLLSRLQRMLCVSTQKEILDLRSVNGKMTRLRGRLLLKPLKHRILWILIELNRDIGPEVVG